MSDGDRISSVEYRAIPECPGYEFGSDATAWSQWCPGRGESLGEWRCMSPGRQSNGHYNLRVKISGVRTAVRLHHMICWAFHGPQPDGMECLFRDGNRDNLSPDNLYWGTTPENIMGPAADYRSIPESDGYLYGSDGSVWSDWGSGRRSRRSGVWKRLALTPNPSGHLSVRVKINGERKQFGVHHLICWAFHGPCPPGMECCHKDGIPDNNVPDNLYWGTRQDNINDQMAHGVFVRGARKGNATFSEDEIREIRRLRAAGNTNRQIAELKGRSVNTIGAILSGRIWKHVV